MKQTMEFDNLMPAEIKLDILSRVPFDTILACKRVCKNWQTLLRYPCFPYMHLRRCQLLQSDDVGEQGSDCYKYSGASIASKKCFLFCCSSEYVIGDYDVNDEQNFNKTIIRSKPIPKTIQGFYVGSYDGLVLTEPLLFSETETETDPYTWVYKPTYDALVVSNPMTREYVNLPSFWEPNTLDNSMIFGFGYDSSTSVYKVIRIFYPSDPKTVFGGSVVGQIYIYTLGRRGCGWSHAGTINYYLKKDPGVLANGALHWLERDNGRIFAFDLADEKFREFAAPPGLDYRFTGAPGAKYILRLMGGWLCLQHNNFATIDIWVLKKKTIENYKHDESWNWTWEFCLVNPPADTYYFPFDVTKSGELLLLWNDCSFEQDNVFQPSLVRYIPKTRDLVKICDTPANLRAEASFVKSFLSLKDLGEEDAKRM